MIKNIIKYLFSILFLCISSEFYAQNNTNFKSARPKAKKKDSITLTARDYKMITIKRDTISIDTTLSVQAMYKMNPIKKDMFEYIPFSNMGQTYNHLSYSFRNPERKSNIGTNANNFYFITSNQVAHYHIPTPITLFDYKTGMQQGQMLHTLFSANISPNLNLFIRYNALRSLGDYQNILSSVGNFIGGISYFSPNKKYLLMAHYANQEVERQENGGLYSVEQFESGDSQFKNRAAIDVMMTNAESSQTAKRYSIMQQYNFLSNADKNHSELLLKHHFEYETQKYSYNQTQTAPYSFLGESYVPTSLNDNISLQTMVNKLGAEVLLPYLGKTFIYGKSYFYNYFLRSIMVNERGDYLPNQIKDTDMGLGIEWKKNYKGFSIDAKGEQLFIGTLLGTNISGKLSYAFNEQNMISAGASIVSEMPKFSYLLYQSDYKNYNWYNMSHFSKQNTQTIFADLKTKWGNASLDISNINNYTYLQLQPSINNQRQQSKPSQYSGNIQYLKLKAEKEIHFGKFSLDNTLMYQQILQGSEDIINVPTLVTRNTLYLSSYAFQKAMFLQTGVTFKYFSSYYADRYNPLLADFEVQSQEKIGNYPVLDFFMNAKVRTMRIYFNIEHFNYWFTKYNYYSAPAQPYRDWKIRLGISWYFFT